MTNRQKFDELIEKLYRSPMYTLSLAGQSDFHLHFFYWLVNRYPEVMTEFFNSQMKYNLLLIEKIEKIEGDKLAIYDKGKISVILYFQYWAFNSDSSADDEYRFPSLSCHQLPEPEEIDYDGCDISNINSFLDKCCNEGKFEPKDEAIIRDYNDIYNNLFELKDTIDLMTDYKIELYSDLFSRTSEKYLALQKINYHRTYEYDSIRNFISLGYEMGYKKMREMMPNQYLANTWCYKTEYLKNENAYQCYFEQQYYCFNTKIKIYCRREGLFINMESFTFPYFIKIGEIIKKLRLSMASKLPKIFKLKSNGILQVLPQVTQYEVLERFSGLIEELELEMSRVTKPKKNHF
jgi:hypothetical protein